MVLVRDLGDPGEVKYIVFRVADAFDVDQPGVVLDRFGDVALKVADELRGAGAIIEFYNSAPAVTARWLLELDENGNLLLTDKAGNKQQRFNDTGSLLALVGGR